MKVDQRGRFGAQIEELEDVDSYAIVCTGEAGHENRTVHSSLLPLCTCSNAVLLCTVYTPGRGGNPPRLVRSKTVQMLLDQVR